MHVVKKKVCNRGPDVDSANVTWHSDSGKLLLTPAERASPCLSATVADLERFESMLYMALFQMVLKRYNV